MSDFQFWFLVMYLGCMTYINGIQHMYLLRMNGENIGKGGAALGMVFLVVFFVSLVYVAAWLITHVRI